MMCAIYYQFIHEKKNMKTSFLILKNKNACAGREQNGNCQISIHQGSSGSEIISSNYQLHPGLEYDPHIEGRDLGSPLLIHFRLKSCFLTIGKELKNHDPSTRT